MSPVALLGAFLTLAVLLHLWWLPLLRDRWRTLETRAKPVRAGALVVAESLRTLAVLGACAMLLVLSLVAVSGWLAGTDAAWPKAVIGAMAQAQATAAAIGKEYGFWLGLLGLAGATLSLWAAARTARQRVVAAWMERATQVQDELLADPAKIESLRTDPELAPLVQRLGDIVGEMQQLDDSPPQQERVAALRISLQEVLSALAIETARKQLDAADATGRPTADEARPQGAWARLRTVLASPQLGRDLGLVKKPLSWVTTALLVVSLVGWSAEPLANSLRLAVNNLQVQLVEREAARDFEQALSRSEAPAEAPPADAVAAAATPAGLQRAAMLSARAAVHAMTRAPLLERSAGLHRAPAGAAAAEATEAAARAQAGAEYVRAALAEQTLPDAPRVVDPASRLRSEVGAGLKTQLAGGAEAVRAAEAAEAASPSMKHLQAAAARELAPLQARNPNALAALLARLEARYAQPMTPLDAQGKLVGELIDTVFDTVDAKPEGELGKQGQKLAKAFGNNAVQTWAEAKLKGVLAEALTGAARPEVVQAFAFRADAEGIRFIEALVDAERSGWQPAARAAEEARVAQEVANKVADMHVGLPAAERAALVDSLAGYDNIFVPDLGPPPARPVHALADALPVAPSGGGGGGGGVGGGSGGGGQGKARASTHGTSFQAASRSFRVRGVIIGREPEGPALDVVDLRWALVPPARPGTPTRMALELRVAEKPGALPTWRPAGTYSAGVLNQALRYAADGRVVATTITGGDGRAVSRLTYLHPVLVDTPLGCRVVEADRWVDTFTLGDARSGAPVPQVLRELASDRKQMMRWLGVAELSERAARASSKLGSCPLPAVRQAVQRRDLGQVRLSQPLQQALDKLVTERRTVTGAASTGLLERAARCAGQSTAELAGCVCEQAANKLPERYWFPEDHTSQVREKPLALTPTLAWLAPTAERLGHLDFWVHTTLSLREAASGERDAGQSAALDFPTEQLKAMRALVTGRLRDHLGKAMRSDVEDFMAPLEEFVLAQRLARAALVGRLGPDFPLMRLLTLERETRPFVTTQPTIRWEAMLSPGVLLAQLEQADQGAALRYRSHFEDQMQRAQDNAPVCGAASR